MARIYKVSELGKEFGLSRTALLYYDSIGLLSPSERTESGYRVYSEPDRERLRTICVYRRTGMPLKAIGKLLGGRKADSVPSEILEHRLGEINELIAGLEKQRRVILSMLGGDGDLIGAAASPEKFVEILRKIGFSEDDMREWHGKLEAEMPGFHRDFLTLLGFSEEEIRRIREWSAGSGTRSALDANQGSEGNT